MRKITVAESCAMARRSTRRSLGTVDTARAGAVSRAARKATAAA